MKNWFVTLIFSVFLIPLAFSMNKPLDEEALNAHQKMCKVWQAVESVELEDSSHLQPHAILYGEGMVMDVFVTFSPGFLKFVNKKEEVPINLKKAVSLQ